MGNVWPPRAAGLSFRRRFLGPVGHPATRPLLVRSDRACPVWWGREGAHPSWAAIWLSWSSEHPGLVWSGLGLSLGLPFPTPASRLPLLSACPLSPGSLQVAPEQRTGFSVLRAGGWLSPQGLQDPGLPLGSILEMRKRGWAGGGSWGRSGRGTAIHCPKRLPPAPPSVPPIPPRRPQADALPSVIPRLGGTSARPEPESRACVEEAGGGQAQGGWPCCSGELAGRSRDAGRVSPVTSLWRGWAPSGHPDGVGADSESWRRPASALQPLCSSAGSRARRRCLCWGCLAEPSALYHGREGTPRGAPRQGAPG